jgi:pimeloyl-ACP methyl ester carboxylesterase
MQPLLKRPEIRRDTVRVLRAAFADRELLVRAAELLPAFDRPALLVWAAGDRVMPPDHGRRLAQLLPQGRLVEVENRHSHPT